ncbi:MAG: hypothetical protein CMM25_00440 [Rhodospirillaceae bacterium]|nr:hypothetical protein [Rhodospirillaceae bacterium]
MVACLLFRKFILVGQLSLVCLVIMTWCAVAQDTTSYGINLTFDMRRAPPAPDYSLVKSWAALPEMSDYADEVPLGSDFTNNQSAAIADVFYIHPTTYRGNDNWNQNIDDEVVNEHTDLSVIARQASAWNACCRIYAPRYRQAGIGALSSKDGSGTKAYALAYTDVRRAFIHYIKTWNNGRPFILVSHSQGSLHAMQLLIEEIDAQFHHQLIVAYVAGFGVSKGVFGRSLKNIDYCRTSIDSHCVASWSTYGRDGSAGGFVSRVKARYKRQYGTSSDDELICWNPVGGVLSDVNVSADKNQGALSGKPMKEGLPPLAAGYGAQCRSGILYTDMPEGQNFELMVLPNQSLHMHDIDLFYENLRSNAVKRTEAFIR